MANVRRLRTAVDAKIGFCYMFLIERLGYKTNNIFSALKSAFFNIAIQQAMSSSSVSPPPACQAAPIFFQRFLNQPMYIRKSDR